MTELIAFVIGGAGMIAIAGAFLTIFAAIAVAVLVYITRRIMRDWREAVGSSRRDHRQ